jgi:dolichol-phosphate mannosyltransferase
MAMEDISRKLLVVIPTYNEVLNIEKLIKKIRKCVGNCGVLIVDDNSPDGTAKVVKEMQADDKNIHLIEREAKLGLATAMKRGFDWGLRQGYEYLCEMDADLSHHPKYLKIFIEKIRKFDFVVGSRYVEGGGVLNWPLRRRILSKLGSLYARLILAAPIHDFTGGYNMWRRQVLETLDLESIKSEGYGFLIEMKHKAFKKGFSSIEIPIVFEDRTRGVSKISKKIILEAIWKVPLFRLRFK